jgi:ANTAR domain/GAF domain
MNASRGPGVDLSSADTDTLRRTAELLDQLARDTHDADAGVGLDLLVDRAAALLPTAGWASVTTLSRGKFRTVASNAPTAVEVDLMQYRHGSGPCVDAVLEDGIFVTPDVAAEPRWQPLGRRLSEQLGISSMLALRLHLVDDSDTIAGLNFSSGSRDAFSAADIEWARILATQCALLVSSWQAHAKAENLLAALESNRQIGTAVGILMARHNFTTQQGFDVLRHASQSSNRKLRDVAAEVILTGTDPETGDPGLGRAR